MSKNSFMLIFQNIIKTINTIYIIFYELFYKNRVINSEFNEIIDTSYAVPFSAFPFHLSV